MVAYYNSSCTRGVEGHVVPKTFRFCHSHKLTKYFIIIGMGSKLVTFNMPLKGLNPHHLQHGYQSQHMVYGFMHIEQEKTLNPKIGLYRSIVATSF